jgi:hypothetical protein
MFTHRGESHTRFLLTHFIPPSYVSSFRTSASELSCRSLNQDLSSVLDVDSLPGGQSGEAAAGEGVVRGEGCNVFVYSMTNYVVE